MSTDHQSTSIVQWNMRSHQQPCLMNSLPHPLHTMTQHCIPRSLPSLRPEVINVRGKLGNSSSPVRISGTLKWHRKESEIDWQRRKIHETLQQLEHTYPGKKGPTVFMWTDDDGHGFFLHMRVPWGEVNNFWEDFTDSQEVQQLWKQMGSLCQVWSKGTNPRGHQTWTGVLWWSP